MSTRWRKGAHSDGPFLDDSKGVKFGGDCTIILQYVR